MHSAGDQRPHVVDFNDPDFLGTYGGRAADPNWLKAVSAVFDPRGKVAVDVGCGGGIYTTALRQLAPSLVVGVDFSAVSIQGALQEHERDSNVQFILAEATATGLRSQSAAFVVQRALIHHLPDLKPAFAEARRVLSPGGILWVQDRTLDDVLQPASDTHVRGWYVELRPDLREIEVNRRRPKEDVVDSLRSVGFEDVKARTLLETRNIFSAPDELYTDITTRQGRSLLRQLDDDELCDLANAVIDRIAAWPVVERDAWTVWLARR